MLGTRERQCRPRLAGPGVGGAPRPSGVLHTPPTKWDPTSKAMTRKSDRTPRWQLAVAHAPRRVWTDRIFPPPRSLLPCLPLSVRGVLRVRQRDRGSLSKGHTKLAGRGHRTRKRKLCLDAASPGNVSAGVRSRNCSLGQMRTRSQDEAGFPGEGTSHKRCHLIWTLALAF